MRFFQKKKLGVNFIKSDPDTSCFSMVNPDPFFSRGSDPDPVIFSRVGYGSGYFLKGRIRLFSRGPDPDQLHPEPQTCLSVF